MKIYRKILVTLTGLFSCCAISAGQDAVEIVNNVIMSEMKRNPKASYLDGRGGKLKWNYTTGLELKAMLDVYDAVGGDEILCYVDEWYDSIIEEDGKITGYRQEAFTLDHICPGRTLIRLYQLTGRGKYLKAMTALRSQMDIQPRTEDGVYWHKKIYPQQVWLDGLYMAEPFLVEYAVKYGGDVRAAAEESMKQFILAAKHTYDPATGLYRHAWDASGSMFWADASTGRSAHCWGRALGWYCMAVVDVLDNVPEDTPGRDEVIGIFRKIMDTLPRYADPVTGMWYQVLDCPGRKCNYPEATASAMFTYAYLKGVRKGWLDPSLREYAVRCWDSLLRTFVRKDDNGLVNLDRCCAVAGLGGPKKRSGTYWYYISEPVISNDTKGIGPLLWAALEIDRLPLHP